MEKCVTMLIKVYHLAGTGVFPAGQDGAGKWMEKIWHEEIRISFICPDI